MLGVGGHFYERMQSGAGWGVSRSWQNTTSRAAQPFPQPASPMPRPANPCERTTQARAPHTATAPALTTGFRILRLVALVPSVNSSLIPSSNSSTGDSGSPEECRCDTRESGPAQAPGVQRKIGSVLRKVSPKGMPRRGPLDAFVAVAKPTSVLAGALPKKHVRSPGRKGPRVGASAELST